MASVANAHCDRIALLNVAPVLALAWTNTNTNHTPWSYQNELCLGCFFTCVSLSFLKTLSFCMSFSYDKSSSEKIGFAWNVFLQDEIYEHWDIGTFAPGSLHLVFHLQPKILKRQSTVTQKVKIMVNLFQEKLGGKGLGRKCWGNKSCNIRKISRR